MPVISAEELAYYGHLERGVGALQYCLVDCRCARFCDHKYMLRGLVNELAADIDARKALAGATLTVAPAHTTLRMQGEEP